MQRAILRFLALLLAAAPASLLAQYTETKMGEYLHYAVAAANGGIYAGYDSIGSPSPSLYQPGTGWTDLSCSAGFNTSLQYFGYATDISRDGSIVSGYTAGVTTGGSSMEFATYWVNTVESIVPAPPDDPAASQMSATGISGDGSTLLVQDKSSAKVETYVFKIATGRFTSLGFLGGTTRQTYAVAINNNGSVVAGYGTRNNGNIDGFIWEASKGLKKLGIPAAHPKTVYLEPTCISDDGSTVFGQLTELNGWVGFRYNKTTGFQDTGGMAPSACTADGSEAVGIQDLYFPAVWSVANGGGYVDHLLSEYGITASGPDAYLTDQTWYGTWQVTLPVPLNAAAIVPQAVYFNAAYDKPLKQPPGTLMQYAEFGGGSTAILVKAPSDASSFAFGADGSFSYTPKAGFGDQTDTFTYKLVSGSVTSSAIQAQISVASHIASLKPRLLKVSTADQVITLTGAGFISTDTVYAEGNPLVTTYLSPQQLTFTLPSAYLAAGARIAITVDDTSNPIYLVVRK